MTEERADKSTPNTANLKWQHSEFEKFVAEFAKESDRAAVILGAAKLDLQLYHLLQAVLRPSTGKTDDLLEGDSPLGTFSARATMCHRLGLVDDAMFRAINLVRRIRNSFAHELSGVSLSSGAHMDRVRELISPLKENKNFQWLASDVLKSMPGPAGDFRAAVALISLRLEGAADEAKPLYDPEPMSLVPPDWGRG